MFRIGACCAVMLLVAGHLSIASAQTTTAPADAKPTKTKLTVQKLKEMKAKGLAGDDRWFYIADCMEKT
jgi:hypothetical protein